MNLLRTSIAVLSGSVLCVTALPHSDKAKPHLKAVPNFAKDVAPILYSKCAPCHHAGEVAPFTLTSYEDARSKAPTIAAAVKSKFMPPWQAITHGEFRNERTLTTAQIQTLQDWATAGAPKGDLKLAPKAPVFTPGWMMGTPDLVVKPPQPYEVAPEGADEYRCFVIPTHFPEGRFVTDVETRPGNRNVVHHVLIYVDTSGVARSKDGKDGKPGYESFGGPGFVPAGSLGGWAPGLLPQSLPKGIGMWLPKGADIVIQVHYHKNGKAEYDQSQVGLKFATGPIDKKVRWESVDNEFISIKPGEKNYEVKADIDLKAPVTVLDVIPHMHLLGHDMTVTATLPDGTKREMIHVEPYDFNWQTRYTYKEPVHLPKGTHLSLVAHYDNSSDNPHNPNNPPKHVRFGEQTTDEMCFAFFTYTFDGEHLTHNIVANDLDGLGGGTLGAIIDRIFDHYDTNHDGALDEAELTQVIEFVQTTMHDNNAKATAQDPKAAAKFVISMYGKAKKGQVTREEFKKLAHFLR